MRKLKTISRREFISYGLAYFTFLTNSSFNLKLTYTLDELMGIKPKNLVSGNGYTLHKDAAGAFEKMQDYAKKDGILIKVVSSFRDYNHQVKIWNNKFNRYIAKGYGHEDAIKEIIKYSTLPGTSRHHWGSDLDIIQGNVDNKYFSKHDPLQEKYFTQSGIFYPLKSWLNKNSAKFGFYEVYTKDINRTGFNYEPWHFSYMPLSKNMLSDFLKYNLETEVLKNNINGIKYINEKFIKNYINQYILGINKILI